uniref:Ig-like domain-containing protein n=1 Tax=Fundulus heteroclitus TaxID=8078 RepID=A0A3Q2PID4_FUNHE
MEQNKTCWKLGMLHLVYVKTRHRLATISISAGAGQTVTLPCQYPDNNTISVVGWSRTDLMEEYVLLYRNEEMDKSHQKPSYWDRVDLQNRLMQNGDVSLVLKDARTYDSGTYECRVVHSGLSEAKLGNSPICTIRLDMVCNMRSIKTDGK